jgi:ATP-dependent Clp protease ATP-binding subunit ClpA
MFERFTDQSRRTVVLAQEEATRFNHNYIGTEHLLAGLRREKRGAAARALESAGITLDAIRGEIETLIGRGLQAPSGHVPFTPRAKKCLELSLREALNLGHNHIGTGHLLLGLVSKDDCEAVQVLGGLGADLGQLRAQVIQEIEDDPEDRGGFSPPRPQRAELPNAVQTLLDTIDERLSAIERHLGIAAERERAAEELAAEGLAADQAAQPDAGDGGSASAGSEADRLRAEVGRLRALLREHDIDPGDPGDASAAAG